MQKNRPAGIAFIAVWFFLNGLSTLGATFAPLFAADLFAAAGLSGAAPILGALVTLLLAAAYFAIAWGLWELRDWARLATMALAGLGLVSSLIIGVLFLVGVTVAGVAIRFPGAGIGFLLVAAVNAAVIWYLMKPDIQPLFGAGSASVSYAETAWEQSGGISFGAGGSTVQETGVPASWSDGGMRTGPVGAPPTVREPSGSMMPAGGTALPSPSVDRTRPLQEPQPVVGWLVVRQGPRVNEQLKLRAGSNTIGRDGRRAELVVDEPSVSGEHAKVRFESGVFVLYDLASTNGTFVNGRRIEKQRLMDNDIVRLGRMEFIFKMVDPRHR